MSVLDDLQQQVRQSGDSAAQGLLQQVQTQLPGLIEQASQHLQAQVPILQQAVAPAVQDLGRQAGAAAREGASGFDTPTLVAVGAGGALVLGLVVYAAVRAGTSSGVKANALGGKWVSTAWVPPALVGEGIDVRMLEVVDAAGQPLAERAVPLPSMSMTYDRAWKQAEDRGLVRWHRVDPTASSFSDHYVRTLAGDELISHYRRLVDDADHRLEHVSKRLTKAHGVVDRRSEVLSTSRTDSASCRSKWGGRHVSWPDVHEWAGALDVSRVHLNRQGYATDAHIRGRYFGTGQPVWEVMSDDSDIWFFIRAADKRQARLEVQRCYPSATVS